MTLQRLSDALTLTPGPDGLTCELHGDFSNGRLNAPPETGFPFGGLRQEGREGGAGPCCAQRAAGRLAGMGGRRVLALGGGQGARRLASSD